MSAAEEVEAVARALEDAYGRPIEKRAETILAALTPIRDAEVLAAQGRAWEKGYSAGWADCGDQDTGGDPTDTPNPYRDLAATHDEGGE